MTAPRIKKAGSNKVLAPHGPLRLRAAWRWGSGEFGVLIEDHAARNLRLVASSLWESLRRLTRGSCEFQELARAGRGTWIGMLKRDRRDVRLSVHNWMASTKESALGHALAVGCVSAL